MGHRSVEREKGTGKSTIVRGIGKLMQDRRKQQVMEASYKCYKDKVIGSQSILKRSFKNRRKSSSKRNLEADGNILYADEKDKSLGRLYDQTSCGCSSYVECKHNRKRRNIIQPLI